MNLALTKNKNVQQTMAVSMKYLAQNTHAVFVDAEKNGAIMVEGDGCPSCVLMTVDDYKKLYDELADFAIEQLAAQRLATPENEREYIPAAKVYEELGISKADLQDCEDIEIE